MSNGGTCLYLGGQSFLSRTAWTVRGLFKKTNDKCSILNLFSSFTIINFTGHLPIESLLRNVAVSNGEKLNGSKQGMRYHKKIIYHKK